MTAAEKDLVGPEEGENLDPNSSKANRSKGAASDPSSSSSTDLPGKKKKKMQKAAESNTNKDEDGSSTATRRQPLSTRPQRGAVIKSRFGFIQPPAPPPGPAAVVTPVVAAASTGQENKKAANVKQSKSTATSSKTATAASSKTTAAAAASKTSKASTVKSTAGIIPQRRPGERGAAAGGGGAVGSGHPHSSRRLSSGLPPPRISLSKKKRPEVDEEEDDDEEGGNASSHLEAMANSIFTQSEAELEHLARGKLKFNTRWDFKEKIAKRDDAIRSLRHGLAALLSHKQEFVKACVEMENEMRADLMHSKDAEKKTADLEDKIEALEARTKTMGNELEKSNIERRKAVEKANQATKEAEKLTTEVKTLRNELKEATQALQVSRKHAEALSHERDGLKDQVTKLNNQLNEIEQARSQETITLKSALEASRSEAAHAADAKNKLEKEAAEMMGRMKEGQGRQAAEAGERARIDAENGELKEDVKGLMKALAEKAEEIGQLKVDNERRFADLLKELLQAQGAKREEEVMRAKAEADVAHLQSKLDGIRDAIDEKNKELSSALKSFADMQRNTSDRETEIRKSLREVDDRAVRAEARVRELEDEVKGLTTAAAVSSSEVTQLKETLATVREEVKVKADADNEARDALQEITSSLKVEKELRSRAEMKEAEERQERIAANAQLLAMQQAHATDMENHRKKEDEAVSQYKLKVKEVEADKEHISRELKEIEEAKLTVESELKTLKRALQDAESRTEQLEELGKISGEAEVLRHRLMEAEKEREAAEQRQAKSVAELEKSILEGETQRRKMHNLIQELRGNVRVYARVRPFLPSDNVGEEAENCINVNGNDDSLQIRKRDAAKKLVLENHAFSFDRTFAPSSGQEVVFNEVSEFVQSALDGYNVCLFSYGQTGSGKTHTMQGISNGPMRGIIPRAMEQVGQYKNKLEGQGWVYQMEVTFVEIYNEQIRDLLRSLSVKQAGHPADDTAVPTMSHDIKRDLKGIMYISDVTRVSVDPNDADAINRIMEIAGRHRSVGATEMNERSSRSHSIFTLHLKASNREQRSELSGKLNLVDLAGSERLSRSNAKGDRLKETQAINKSLSALTDVFVAIANKQQHVPYRNSKLTYLLQQSLSGDGKTLMMVNLSPTEESYFESLCTLRFASQVNRCELGQAKRHLQTVGGPLERASTATAATASSSSRGTKK